MNKQREAVYGLRRQLLEGVDQKDLILEDYVSGILGDLMDQFCPVKGPSRRLGHLKGLKDAIFTRFGVDILAEGIKPETLNRQELGDAIFDKLKSPLRRQRKAHRPRCHALPRAHDHVERARLAVERPPASTWTT